MSSPRASDPPSSSEESKNSLEERKESDEDLEDSSASETDVTQRILKGATFIFSGSVIGKAIGFALQLTLARGFGKALYGLYTIGLTVLRLGQSVATLGLQNGIVRFGAPQYEGGDTAKLKGTFLAGGGIGLAAGTVLGIGLFAASPWLATRVFSSPEGIPVDVLEHTIAIFGVGLPFYILTYLASRMARAVGTMQIDTLLDSILQPAFFLVLVGGILLFGAHFTLALYAFLASTILSAITGVYLVYRLFPPLLSTLSPEVEIRPLLRFSLPIVGVSLATMGLTYTDRLMLGILRTSEAVGLYQAAAVLSSQMHFVVFAITAAFSPIISDLYQNGRLEALSRLYANTVRWIVLTTLPAALVLVIFAPQILSIWGSGFADGAAALRILTSAHLIIAAVGSVGHMLQMSDHQDFVFSVNASTALLNVLLNWVLIQEYGVLGAAVATGISQALGDLIEVGGLYYFLSVHPFRWSLWKPFAAAGLACAGTGPLYVVLSGHTVWMIGIPALLILYGSLLFGLGLNPKDRSILNDLWRELSPSSPK